MADAEVRIALRLGAYQLLFLDRIPARAAIYESVELVKRARKRSASALVNAVLRKLAAEPRVGISPVDAVHRLLPADATPPIGWESNIHIRPGWWSAGCEFTERNGRVRCFRSTIASRPCPVIRSIPSATRPPGFRFSAPVSASSRGGCCVTPGRRVRKPRRV